MSAPLFSVVIPTFNRSDLVTHAIQSILRQTWKDVEVIVCDNCSTDDTPAVVGRLDDPRLRYVRTPRHGVIAESWEFARTQATGQLILMLSDDDALVPDALERFAREAATHGADLLFCKTAEYRDRGFPGAGRNTLRCPAFTTAARRIPAEEFLQPLFAFKLRFDMHPSAFFFGRELAERVAARCGRFFRTNGVEYYAWPLAAALARGIVYIDAPLAICGRTGKSWGSNLKLGNPGKEKIEELIADVEQDYRHAPFTNFTICNLWAEGLLTAQKLLPQELGPYRFDEAAYVRATMKELRRRQAVGVNVEREIDEVRAYVRRNPALGEALAPRPGSKDRRRSWLRARVGDVGVRALRRRLGTYAAARKVKRGEVRSGFRVAGKDFAFNTITECAEFVGRIAAPAKS